MGRERLSVSPASGVRHRRVTPRRHGQSIDNAPFMWEPPLSAAWFEVGVLCVRFLLVARLDDGRSAITALALLAK